MYVVSPSERREKKQTHFLEEKQTKILRIQTLNLTKTNLIEKGIGTIAIEYQYLNKIKKFFSKIKFDLVLYSTPPITFTKVIDFIKNRDNAYSYLLLKDIFPQNAVDMKMLKEKGFLHRFFLKKEKKLYRISDKIGCMSEANKKYILKHNPDINSSKVEVNPNSIMPIIQIHSTKEKQDIRNKYGLPLDKKVFVYGGSLGKPQGIDFLLATIDKVNNLDVFFLIVGTGTEFKRIQKWFFDKKISNALLLEGLPKKDYDTLLNACDVGLIFLHKDFTIPNFPSRFLSYLEMKMPVIAATDIITDIGLEIENNNCGFWVHSGDIKGMLSTIDKIYENNSRYNSMKENAWNLLQKKYKVEYSFNLIIEKLHNV